MVRLDTDSRSVPAIHVTEAADNQGGLRPRTISCHSYCSDTSNETFDTTWHLRNARDREASREEDPSALEPAIFEVETAQNKAVNRRLGGIHIFMITISGVLGGIQGGVLFFLVPATLVIINAFGIQLYGLIEVVGGTLKLLFLAVITLTMIAINQGAGPQPKIGTSLYPDTVIVRDQIVTDTWAQAFLMSLSIAAFAYVGIEITAASALEARVTKERPTSAPRSRTIGRTVKFSAIWIPFLATVVYVLAGILVTLNIKWNDDRLPRMSWVTGPDTTGPSASNATIGSTSSAFVLVAEDSGIPGLASTMNVFLMFTALSCANTNLYVASRTLFALTRNIESGPNTPWYDNILAYFGRTNNRKVPLAAILASCIFAWIPFLYLATEHGPSTSIGAILDVLSEMGSIGVIIVWACECWAYIRFHKVVMNNKEALHRIRYVRRWDRFSNTDDYPYRGHGQPLTAYASLLACLFILLVANGASLWKEFRIQQFLAAYLAPICFLLLWLVLKLRQGSRGRWRLVDLSDDDALVNKIEKLHELRWRSADASEDSAKGFQNLWGLL
ncbi:hypothetical protein E8E13_006129 [Curvularia kusanoi]|uniref:Amino acid permease/ SLC12A domain-containing protein n=1 Tax=Curvularia kusanoi TaxID=90978 RepID=A0A9P4WAJ8_CURKU|nr:hypothetical protein E8E13_006129 [Curvularia kusanoi]